MEPRVRCLDCEFAWHSSSMAHGLALLGSCPRCGGELSFAPDARMDDDEDDARGPESSAPHRVLGLPRPTRR
jgi:hypothetical protein